VRGRRKEEAILGEGVFAKKLMAAHVKVLAAAAILFLFLGFIDRIPDDPGVFREPGLNSAQSSQGPVGPDHPADLVSARLLVNGYAAATAIWNCERPSVDLLYCNSHALLSLASDSSPPVS
jgi:hypothetical protein